VILFRVEPEYSEEARKARYQGTVVLQAIVRRDGKVDVLQLVRSLGFGLDQNAIDALKKWRFRPAMKDGKAVDVTMNFEVTFNIR
jgi:TonB family protein